MDAGLGAPPQLADAMLDAQCESLAALFLDCAAADDDVAARAAYRRWEILREFPDRHRPMRLRR